MVEMDWTAKGKQLGWLEGVCESRVMSRDHCHCMGVRGRGPGMVHLSCTPMRSVCCFGEMPRLYVIVSLHETCSPSTTPKLLFAEQQAHVRPSTLQLRKTRGAHATCIDVS